MLRILGTISASRQRDVIKELDRSSTINRDFVVLVVLSCVIATLGLVQDSAAVIIGAMLIAPLMSPIIAFSMALVLGDLRQAGRAFLTLMIGVALAIGISFALGQAVSAGRFNFLEQLPAEIVGRTHPTLFDLAIALAGGAAAAYALAKPELSATLPGVAIATALMPPVCTAGIGLALRREDVAGGAFLLFLANFVAISFASSAVFVGMGFRPPQSGTLRGIVSSPLLLSGSLLLVVAIPLGFFMLGVAQDSLENTIIQSTIESELTLIRGSSLVSFEASTGSSNDLAIVATVRAPQSLSYEDSVQMQRDLATRLHKTVALQLLVVPLTRLNPLAPPTPVPTLPPGATVLPTPTFVPSPTIQPSPTPSLIPTFSPTSSPTSSPTPSPTLTPTETTTPTSTLTPTNTPVMSAVIGGTDHQGVNVRRQPGLSAVIATVSDGILVQLTGTQVSAGGVQWIEVVLPNGLVGWVEQPYLVPYHVFRAP